MSGNVDDVHVEMDRSRKADLVLASAVALGAEVQHEKDVRPKLGLFQPDCLVGLRRRCCNEWRDVSYLLYEISTTLPRSRVADPSNTKFKK